MSEYYTKISKDNQQEYIDRLKKKYTKRTELNFVKLTVLGKGTCIGEDDCFRDRANLQKRLRKVEEQ